MPFGNNSTGCSTPTTPGSDNEAVDLTGTGAAMGSAAARQATALTLTDWMIQRARSAMHPSPQMTSSTGPTYALPGVAVCSCGAASGAVTWSKTLTYAVATGGRPRAARLPSQLSTANGMRNFTDAANHTQRSEERR